MSRITNNRFSPGETITEAAVDAKFEAFHTATDGAVDEANVRSEGIDVGNVYSNAVSTGAPSLVADAAETIAVKMAAFASDETVITVGNDVVGSLTVTELERVSFTGTPLVLTSTDVLRVYWQVQLGNDTNNPWPTVGGVNYRPVNGNVNITDKQKDATGGIFWLVWPQYASTNAPHGGWTDFSNQPNPVTDTSFLANTSNTVMPIPHFMWNEYHYSLGTPTPIPVPPVVGATPNMTEAIAKAGYARGCFWIPAGDTTIYGIRIVIRGLYRMTTNGTAAPGQSTFFDFGSAVASYAGTGASPNMQKINIGARSLGVIAMRKS